MQPSILRIWQEARERLEKISQRHTGIWYFPVHEQADEQTVELPMISDAKALLLRHCYSHMVCSYARSGLKNKEFPPYA